MSVSSTTTWPSGAPAPDAIPDLRLLRWIGKGGFGQVWLAENLTTGRLLAVKLVPLESDRFPTAPAIREIQSIRRVEQNRSVRHPNLLMIHHVGKTEDYLYYTMDPADDITGGPASRGEAYAPATLGTRLQAGRLTTDPCVVWARQLLAALAHLHQQGLVHRDVKPDNCLFLDGELKLADFGLVTDADHSISLAGTLKYMPKDRTMDARADVYAAGLVLYEMVTGNPVERFPSLVPDVDRLSSDPRLAVVNRIVLRATETARDRRYADAREMLSALQQALERSAKVNTATGIPKRIRRLAAAGRRSPATVGLGGLSLLGLLAAGWWAVFNEPTGPPIHVNFISEPYGAQIVLNGSLIESDSGPYVTPCSVPGLKPEVYDVVFLHPDFGDIEAGAVDFARVREVYIQWPTEPEDADQTR